MKIIEEPEMVLAAKDKEIEKLKHALEVIKANREEVRSDYHYLLSIRDARIVLLERALKPVMECDVSVRGYGVRIENAVREAQRIMKEGENNDK